MTGSPIERRLHVLGPTELVEDGAVVHLRPSERRLLSILALSPGASMSSDTAVDRLWDGAPPRTGHNTLQVHVASIRRCAPGLIETVGDSYRLATDGTAVDAIEFTRLATAANRASSEGRLEDVIDLGDEALAHWRGDPFADLIDSGYAAPERARLAESRLQLVELRLGAMLATGRVEAAIPDLEAAVIDHPLRERLWELLMLARYRLGRQAEALRAFQRVSTLLGDELGVEPSARLRALEHDILMQAPGAGGFRASNPHNLPQYEDAMIGRSHVLDELVDAVLENHIVTITGGPGVGKSRLAVELGWRLLDDHPGGVRFVRLQGATTGSDVVASIATAMGIAAPTDDVDTLGRLLARRSGVLIIDDGDHLVGPLHELGTSFSTAEPDLRIILSSRRKMGVQGERVFNLPSLTLPAVGSEEATMLESEAMQLLLDRARMVTTSFEVRVEEMEDLAWLCRDTGGIPLAIELAGRWLPTLGPRNLNDVRSHERQPSIDGAIDLSYRLLADADRQLLACLTVLEAPAGLRSIEGVSPPSMSRAQVAGSVVRLVEASLLTVDTTQPGGIVYSMLQPIREFASRTPEAGELLVDARIWHASWFGSLAVRVASESLERIDRVIPDLRTAMRTLMDDDRFDEAGTLAVSLRAYWDARYQTWEAQRWLDEVLRGDLSPSVRLEASWSAGWVAYNNHDYPAALARYRECRELAAATGDQLWFARALRGVGLIGLPFNRLVAESLIEATVELFLECGADVDRATSLLVLGGSAAWRGDSRLSQKRLEMSDDLIGEDASSRHWVLSWRAQSLAAHLEGRHDDARTLAFAAESIAREAGDSRGIGSALIQRTLVEAAAGNVASAAACISEALGQLPDTARIDHALVLLGAIPVLVEAGELDAARRVFSVIDAVYAEYGWAPVASVNPIAADYRSRLGDFDPAEAADHVATRDDALAVLSVLAN
jgi:DNA-binding SARP family transcriptional activator/predicted ATPase